MSTRAPPSPKRPRRSAKARVKGGGAIAQGNAAKAVGNGGVLIDGNNSGPINIYQTLVKHADRPGASASDLRNAYLAWLSLKANDLPLLAGESGDPVQLSSIYTALLTQAPAGADRMTDAAARADAAIASHNADRLSALEVLDRERYLVLMGGPGSGKSTFLNFVALCMAGEMLGLATANLALLCTPIAREPDATDKKARPQRWTHQALLPLRVVLRDFAADLPPPGTAVTAGALWGFIVRQLPEQLKRYANGLQAELWRKGGLILLDGLDEVPDALQRRVQLKQAVREFAGMHPKCRFLVTSRTYAYQRQDWKLDGFAEAELLGFTRGQIERFIQTWYAHMVQLFRLAKADADARAEVLKRATGRAELRELAERPLLLTLMARLQTKGGGTLPENREELYAQSVSTLLDEWERLKPRAYADGKPIAAEPSLSEWFNANRENIRRELDKLAYKAHLDQPTLVGTADIRQIDLIEALMAASKDNADARFTRLEEYLRDRAGLLSSHGAGFYQFPHRSFQEYLAACHLARFKFPDALSSLAKADPNRWREVMLLAAARSKATPSSIWELVEELCAKDDAPAEDAPEPAVEAQWGALLAGQVLRETGLAAPDPDLQERHERKRARVRDWQVRLLTSTLLPARERALAGDLLARLGETRRHLLDVDCMRFAAVPRGAFWMGEERDSNANLHRNEGIDYDYWIAQAPVTVAQFGQFVASSGYQGHGPACLRDPGNRPVASVTWHDAQAFCAWLTGRWRHRLPEGWRVTLPSEAEWEKAARGGLRIPVAVQLTTAEQGFSLAEAAQRDNPLPQRAYPWSEAFAANNANTEMDVGASSTPGCFDLGRSPYGCDDMAGNVWEWMRSLWGKNWGKPEFKYPYDAYDVKREDPESGDDVLRVVRGGSWGGARDGARCAVRGGGRPGGRNSSFGFRVVLRSAPVR